MTRPGECLEGEPRGYRWMDGAVCPGGTAAGVFREVLLIKDTESEYTGWLCRRGESGRWITLREASSIDLRALEFRCLPPVALFDTLDRSLGALTPAAGPVAGHLVLRPALSMFAQEIERRLRSRDEEGAGADTRPEMVNRLLWEARELVSAILEGGHADRLTAAADLAGVALASAFWMTDAEGRVRMGSKT